MLQSVLKETKNEEKYDLDHIAAIHKIIQDMFSKYFGYDKYVLF